MNTIGVTYRGKFGAVRLRRQSYSDTHRGHVLFAGRKRVGGKVAGFNTDAVTITLRTTDNR